MADVETKVAPAEETTATEVVEKKEEPTESTGAEGQKYEFGVKMSCGGCSGAINRVLGKLDGVKKYDVSLDSQTAVAWADPSVSYQTVLDKILGTKKTVLWGKENGEDRSIEPSAVSAAA